MLFPVKSAMLRCCFLLMLASVTMIYDVVLLAAVLTISDDMIMAAFTIMSNFITLTKLVAMLVAMSQSQLRSGEKRFLRN